MSAAGGYVLGVDGGGTRTRCAVVSLAGRVLAEGEAGPSNYLRVGAEAATANALAAVAEAVGKAGVMPGWHPETTEMGGGDDLLTPPAPLSLGLSLRESPWPQPSAEPTAGGGGRKATAPATGICRAVVMPDPPAPGNDEDCGGRTPSPRPSPGVCFAAALGRGGKARRPIFEAGVRLPAAAACVCLAGVGRRENHAEMLPRFLHLGERVLLDTDAVAALAGAHALGPGVVVIAGTGAVAFGRRRDGGLVRADGWGPVLGDEGSGYWIGVEVLRAVTRAADGRGAATALVGATLGHFGLAAPPDLVNRLRFGEHSTADIADLAKVCSRTAGEGDEVAAGILARAGEALGETCLCAIRALGEADAPAVAAVGGVFEDARVAGAFRGRVEAECPEARVGEPRLRPVLGAALMALELAGVQVSESTVANLEPEP